MSVKHRLTAKVLLTLIDLTVSISLGFSNRRIVEQTRLTFAPLAQMWLTFAVQMRLTSAPKARRSTRSVQKSNELIFTQSIEKPQQDMGGQKALIGHPKEQPISTTIKVSQNLVKIVKFG